MSETRGFYSLWLREIKRFIRDRTRLVTSFVQPLLWLIIFGAAFAARIALPPGFKLSAGSLSRHNRSDTAFHSYVHGHKRYLGQRIRLHERNISCARFQIDNFSRKNGRRQHRCFHARHNCFRHRLSHRYPNKPANDSIRTACYASCHIWLSKHWINNCKLHG